MFVSNAIRMAALVHGEHSLVEDTCISLYQGSDFINLADLFLEDLLIDIPTDKKSILFGIHSKPFDSIENYVILAAKQ